MSKSIVLLGKPQRKASFTLILDPAICELCNCENEPGAYLCAVCEHPIDGDTVLSIMQDLSDIADFLHSDATGELLTPDEASDRAYAEALSEWEDLTQEEQDAIREKNRRDVRA